ncbi:MAG: DUF4249 family protein [Flavobacteriales bacterium]
MKKFSIYFIVVAFLFGCKKQLSDVPQAPIVVKGYLYGNQPISDIYLESVATTREFEQQVNQPISNAEVQLKVNNEIIVLTPHSSKEGYYTSPDTVLVDADYELLVNHEGQTLTASCYVPPKPAVTDELASQSTLSNPMPSDLILTLTWNLLDSDIEYLISLTPNSEELEPLGFGEESGQFYDIFALPIKDNVATFNGSFFTYKGNHTVTVFSITKDYSNFLNYLPTSFDRSLYTAPNNISNGYGVFAGLTGDEVEFTLAE